MILLLRRGVLRFRLDPEFIFFGTEKLLNFH